MLVLASGKPLPHRHRASLVPKSKKNGRHAEADLPSQRSWWRTSETRNQVVGAYLRPWRKCRRQKISLSKSIPLPWQSILCKSLGLLCFSDGQMCGLENTVLFLADCSCTVKNLSYYDRKLKLVASPSKKRVHSSREAIGIIVYFRDPSTFV
jgi:hypothetical protein